MGKYGMSETDKVRGVLSRFCKGDGVDLGYGGSTIMPTAITVDMEHGPYTNLNDDPQHLHGDARDLYWFQNGVLDYVYSSALLEDFEPHTMLGVLKEWLRVLKVGGNLILYLPDEQVYREFCASIGEPSNPGHQNPDLCLSWFKDNMVHYLEDVEVIHEEERSGDYMFEIVLRKKERGVSMEFINLYKEVAEHTLLTPDRLWHLWVNARDRVDLEGDMAECGAFMGGSAYLLHNAVHARKHLHVFDTFEGIPSEQRLDGEHAPGDFTCGYDVVKLYLEPCRNIKLYKGLVPGSLEEVKDLTFNLVHLDMDLYEPTLAAMKFFWPRLVVGGAILLDDYKSLFGVDKAVDEFLQSTNTGIKFVNTTTMQCMLVKE
jgi:predicted SAM-dependent methyltransferase